MTSQPLHLPRPGADRAAFGLGILAAALQLLFATVVWASWVNDARFTVGTWQVVLFVAPWVALLTSVGAVAEGRLAGGSLGRAGFWLGIATLASTGAWLGLVVSFVFSEILTPH